MKLTLTILAIALVGMAQQEPAKPIETAKPQDPPKITSEMREAFFHAKADLQEFQAKLEDADKRMKTVVAAMQAVCPVMLDQQGTPQCAPPATAENKLPEKK